MATAEQVRLFTSLRQDGLDLASAAAAVIELSARYEPWKTEMRGPDGRWISSHGAGHDRHPVAARQTRPNAMHDIIRPRQPATLRELHQRRVDREAASRQAVAARHAETRVIAHGTAVAQSRSLLMPEIAKVQAAQNEKIAALTRSVRLANQRLAEMGEQKESKSAKMKLAVEAGVTVAGGLMAVLEAKYGVPDIFALASAMGPLFIQQIIEWAKRL